MDVASTACGLFKLLNLIMRLCFLFSSQDREVFVRICREPSQSFVCSLLM